MWRSLIIIVFLCGALAWVLTSGSGTPQRSGTLTLKPAPDFPKDRQADLGRTVARILPHCPGLARFGGEVIFTGLQLEDKNARILFDIPASSSMPESWGAANAQCIYSVQEETLLIARGPCQALCLGKLPEPPQDLLEVNLKPAPSTGK